jgi:hypothetical protein
MTSLLLMIGQPLLYVMLHCLGVSVALAIGPRTRPHLCGAFGFTTGLAVMVAIELVLLGTGVPFTGLTGSLAGLAVIAGCLVLARRRGWPAREAWRVLAGWTIGFAVVAFALTRVNLVIMTYDSHYIVIAATMISEDGALTPGVMTWLGDYGIFTVAAQALMCFTAESFLWALPVVLSASTIAIFAVMLDHGLDALGVRTRRRRILVALVTAATFTTFMLIRHSFYIQTNFGTATYLLAFCTLFWWAEVSKDTSAMPLAFIALFAVALHRIEGPGVAVLFLTLSLLPSRLPARAVLPSLTAMTVAVAAWYLLLASGVSASSEFLTPNKAYLMAGIVVAFTAYAALSAWGVLPWLSRINQWAPLIVIGVLVPALAVGFSVRYELMFTSAKGWLQCLALAPYWQHTWLAIIVLAALGLLAPPAPARSVFVCGIPAYMMVILLLVLGRTHYYFGLGDSATRMSVHLVPLAFFYFGVKFIPLFAAREPA